jgi:hypothetical protein
MSLKEFIVEEYENDLHCEYEAQQQDGARWSGFSEFVDAHNLQDLATFIDEDVSELEKEYKLALETCEHNSIDDNMCLFCGEDLTEEIVSRLEDQAKDFRKYGDF